MDAVGIAITLYAETQVLIGFVYLPYGQRLSDLLNSATERQPKNKGTFLELSGVTVFHTDGRKERPETAYINKATIQLVATADSDAGRGIGAKVGSDTYPFVQKSPVRAKMCVPGYEIRGTMHCARGQRVRQLLEERLMFLPLTDVKIRASDKDIWWAAPFVAVNREQISILQHEEFQ